MILGLVKAECRELSARGDAELWIGLVEVLPHGPQAQEEVGGDVPIGQPLSGELDNLVLLRGKPGDVVDAITPGSRPAGSGKLAAGTLGPYPGMGFSGWLSGPGWAVSRTAGAFAELMARLGYERYGTQGGGGGANLSLALVRQLPDRLVGIHVNALVSFPSQDPAELPEDAFSRDRILTDISGYWFTGTAGSTAHLYYEIGHDPTAYAPKPRGTVPTAVLLSPGDVTIRRFAERDSNVVRWTQADRGGAYLALEQPDLMVDDVRAFYGSLAG